MIVVENGMCSMPICKFGKKFFSWDFMCILEDLESDYFGKLEPKLSIIRNLNDQVLFINQGNQPVFEDMPDSDCSGIVNIHL